MLKIALSQYISCEVRDLYKIWYADANFNHENGSVTKSRNFANSRWRTDAILKIDFGYIGALLAD